MSASNKVLVIAVASILLLVAVIHYGAQQAPSVKATVNDLPQVPNSYQQKQAAAQSLQSATTDEPQVSTDKETLSPEDQKKLDLFREVVASGHDNDKRVDTELKNLSPALKQALEKEYSALPKEHRNGRGFVAFLIGRSLSDVSDVEFLEQVINEQPCLSFTNCDERRPMYAEADEHSTGVTLNYPQIVATRMLKQNLDKAPEALRARISQDVAGSRY